MHERRFSDLTVPDMDRVLQDLFGEGSVRHLKRADGFPLFYGTIHMEGGDADVALTEPNRQQSGIAFLEDGMCADQGLCIRYRMSLSSCGVALPCLAPETDTEERFSEATKSVYEGTLAGILLDAMTDDCANMESWMDEEMRQSLLAHGFLPEDACGLHVMLLEQMDEHPESFLRFADARRFYAGAAFMELVDLFRLCPQAALVAQAVHDRMLDREP